MGIRKFGVKRQMRAIEGQYNLTVAPPRRNEGQIRTHGRSVGKENGGSMRSVIPICPDSCKGKAWGPHAIHICDFDS